MLLANVDACQGGYLGRSKAGGTGSDHNVEGRKYQTGERLLRLH